MHRIYCCYCKHLFSGPQVDRAVLDGRDQTFLCERCRKYVPDIEFIPVKKDLDKITYSNLELYFELIDEFYKRILLPGILENSRMKLPVQELQQDILLNKLKN